MSNNNNMTMGEMADIAESIISGRPLTENLLSDLAEFINNYKNMQGILVALQSELKDMARDRGRSKSRLMGDGTIIKAINSSKKVDIQMQKMNKDARDFIKYFREVMESR